MSFKKLMLATLLAAIMLIFTVSLVVAAPAGFDRAGTSRSGVAWSQVITPTTTLSKTHPVGLAISVYFDIPYTQVMTLRDSGFGFGVIARAYLTAKVLSGTLTAASNRFAGTLNARAIGNVNNTVGTGTFDGQFFGREAQEMAGQWGMASPDGSVKAWGAFGATR